jgi:hypothetical protein
MIFFLECNSQQWKFKLGHKDVKCIMKFSDYFKDIIDNSDESSIIYLSGFHLANFIKILEFCRHHEKQPNFFYDQWDNNYLKNLKKNIFITDFVDICNKYDFQHISRLIK